ncbi:MAG: flagellar type III secretion system pore protein FliP [Candidatus Anammoxibacter sp.]
MRLTIISMLFAVFLFVSLNGVVSGADEASETGKNSSPFNMTFSIESENGSGSTSSVLKIALFLTLMSVLPGLLMSMTSFLRIIIVISFLKQAMGTPQMPPNQIVVGIAIFLTMYVMSPVWTEINTNAIQPYVNKEISEKEAFTRGLEPLRNFMLHQTREDDIALFLGISQSPRPASIKDIPTTILIPAFIISELKTGFQMGFILYLPFIVIDAVISTTLTAMGMFMLPPVMISLPFKLVLFVLADGWRLVIQSLVSSFRY